MRSRKIAILGTVGVPAIYGGFETLAENLVRHHDSMALPDTLTVYCSGKSYPAASPAYLSAWLKYVPLNANGVQSIPYDIWSLFSAIWSRNDVILLLGVSGAIVLPLIRLFSSARIVTNIDGIEWRREKWQGLAKRYLHFSEQIAVHFSHEVIADNGAIAEYVKQTYGVDSYVIAYGGDHAMSVESVSVAEYGLPENYAFSVCRIEPENNIHMVLEAFAKLNVEPSVVRQAHHERPHDLPAITILPLVMVGNWNNSEYGHALRKQYASCSNLYLLDPIYDLGKLKMLRSRALLYVHGHSAGGTNPSLVEAMHFGKAVLAFDCDYNRSTTEDKALFFRNSEELQQLIKSMDMNVVKNNGQEMREIANRRYTWNIVARQYFELIGKSV